MAFPETSILDDFNRANEGPPPSSDWTNAENGLKVVSNHVEGDQNGLGNWSNWNTQYGPDCECYVLDSEDLSIAINAYARLSANNSTDVDGYRASIFSDEVKLYRHDEGSGSTQLGSTAAVTQQAGDGVGIECIGSTIKAYFWDDSAGSWSEEVSATDANHSGSGYIGMRIYAKTYYADDFGGGTVGGGGSIVPLVAAYFRRMRNFMMTVAGLFGRLA